MFVGKRTEVPVVGRPGGMRVGVRLPRQRLDRSAPGGRTEAGRPLRGVDLRAGPGQPDDLRRELVEEAPYDRPAVALGVGRQLLD